MNLWVDSARKLGRLDLHFGCVCSCIVALQPTWALACGAAVYSGQPTCMSTRVRFMPQEAFQRPSQHTIRALRPRECLVKLRRQRRRVRQSQHCTPADACARQGGARVLGGGANRLSRERTEDGHLRPHSERPSSKDRAMRTAWLRTARNSSLSTLMLSDEPLHLEQPRPAVRLAHTLNRQPIRTLICMRACVSACVQGGAP